MIYVLVFLTLFLSGCVTRYKPYSFFNCGGYSEIKTTEDSYIVEFQGNALTSKGEVIQYALLRAAELTRENGYAYFCVQSTNDNTQRSTYGNTYGSSIHLNTVEHPGVVITINCFKDKPQGIAVIDAADYIKRNMKT